MSALAEPPRKRRRTEENSDFAPAGLQFLLQFVGAPALVVNTASETRRNE
jgi:hypothetical protein